MGINSGFKGLNSPVLQLRI